ncbi:hypothetical protein YPPY64_2632, partial [Yersinia pestis PY-64]
MLILLFISNRPVARQSKPPVYRTMSQTPVLMLMGVVQCSDNGSIGMINGNLAFMIQINFNIINKLNNHKK